MVEDDEGVGVVDEEVTVLYTGRRECPQMLLMRDDLPTYSKIMHCQLGVNIE